MKINWKTLIISILIPLLTGGAAALLTGGGMSDFEALEKPPLSPPAWLFPVVWTVLYVLMGIAAYLIKTSDAPREEANGALTVYYAQLFLNFLWPILFFGFDLYWAAFVCLVLLWLGIGWTALRFYRIRPVAAYLLLPYLAWVTFAGYLNAAIAVLN